MLDVKLKRGRGEFAVAVVNSDLWVFGGRGGWDLTEVLNLETLEVKEKAWSCQSRVTGSLLVLCGINVMTVKVCSKVFGTQLCKVCYEIRVACAYFLSLGF